MIIIFIINTNNSIIYICNNNKYNYYNINYNTKYFKCIS